MTNASSTAKPVPVTPNTPAARSESVKNPRQGGEPPDEQHQRDRYGHRGGDDCERDEWVHETSGFMMRAAGWRDASAT